ncbi:hypothetical protein A4Z71_06620 [Candidatus Rhodoluna planktonica]|uniref:Major facilitator superfamily (MFS) profile domain-containing protein n=2 Tax=Candidatus Rhodoluna planktonica TaxID=535712 RepID=A0A1D9E0N5_9MICO|nr:hypothetical protein A4Z71_06620 [Candidatus Rhodoluna planktonica]
MVTYRLIDLGAESALVGVVGATFALAPLIFAIKLGRWVDKGRDGSALFVGGLVSTGTSVALLFINSIPLLAIAMPLMGIGHLLTMIGGQTIIANRSQSAKYEKNFGLLTFYASLGQAIGPLVGGALADRGVYIDTNSAILFACFLFVASTLVTIPIASNSKKGKEKQQAQISAESLRKVMSAPTFKSAIFVSGSITAVVDVVLIFLPLLGRELGLSATEIGILLAVRSVSSMAIRLVLGPVTGKIGMRAVMNLGSSVTMLSCIAIALATNFWLLFIIMLVSGLSMAIGQPASMAWVSRIASPETRGLAISIRLTSNRLGQVVVPSIAGLIAATGVGAVFYLLAALQAASIVVTSRALPKGE